MSALNKIIAANEAKIAAAKASPIQKALDNADKIIAANADLERISAGRTLEREVDRAIVRENANPQGLPPEDIAALDVPYSPSRSYVVGLPVVITVYADGSVKAEVDLSEASDIDSDHACLEQDTSDEVIDADSRTIENAVVQAEVVVSA